MTIDEALTRTEALRSQSDKEHHEYLDLVEKALRKEIPVRPANVRILNYGSCPICGYGLIRIYHESYCGHCGTTLRWERDNDGRI